MANDRPPPPDVAADCGDAYRLLFESSLYAVLLTSPDGGILAANAAACRMLGRTEHELLSLGRSAVVDPTDPRLPLAVEESRRTGRFAELTFRRADGQPFPVELSTAVFTDPQGRALTAMVVRDISERVAAEEALRRSERFAHAILDAQPAHIAILDQRGVIVRVNRAWRDFAASNGGTAAVCEGADYLAVCDAVSGPDAADAGRMGRSIRAALEGRGWRAGFDYACPGPGTPRWFSVQLGTVDDEVRCVAVSHYDVTDRYLAEEAVRASNQQLRALATRVQTAREEERAHVAREIHDVLAQDLTRLKIDLVWLASRLERCGGEGCVLALTPRVTAMTDQTDATIRAVQTLATGLRPAVLDSLGLCAAVEWHVKEVQERSGLDCRVDVPVEDPFIGPDVATAAFRIVQESLTNVLRHAAAEHTLVRVTVGDDGLRVEVRDDGRGMEAGVLSDPDSIGMTGMRERARLLGGHVTIHSLPGQGTTVTALLPLVPLASGGTHP